MKTENHDLTKLINAHCSNPFCNKDLKVDLNCIFQLKVKRNLCTNINTVLFQKVKTEQLHNTYKSSKNPSCNTKF